MSEVSSNVTYYMYEERFSKYYCHYESEGKMQENPR